MRSVIVFAFLFGVASGFEFRMKPMVRELFPSTRITNGKNATANQFPYQVGVSVFDGTDFYFCGGSLISKEWVLTAAHCTVIAESVTIYLGSITRLDPTVSYSVNQSSIISHEDFDFETVTNDIALIKIPAVQFSDAIQPVALPKRGKDYPNYVGKTVIASGWGYASDESTSMSPILKYADFTVIPNEVCAEEYGSTVIYPGKLCTATPNQIATCSGDSGGPLVLASSKVQIGITSFGSDQGCEVDIPDAFTRVSYYLDWIQENTAQTF